MEVSRQEEELGWAASRELGNLPTEQLSYAVWPALDYSPSPRFFLAQHPSIG
jgi:hypothetical protein